MKRKIYLALSIVFVLVFVGSVAGIGITLYRYRQADEVYSDLQYRYVVPIPQETEQTSDDTVMPEQNEIAVTPISVNFDALTQENGDIVGWLYCEDTPINYPVVQSHDNDYYLHRDLNGKYLVSGTLFTDYRCSTVGTDQNHIIYGHNMKNNTMFGTLVKYKDQDYYNEHPILYYLTPEKNYAIELFAGMVTTADSEVYTPEFDGAEKFKTFLQNIKAKSTFVSDVSVNEADHIVTLSTCSYEFGNARYVIFGKLTCLSEQD